MRFQIQNTKLRIVFSKTPQQDGTEVHHEERQIGGIGDSLFFDIHKIIQTPILLGVAEIELDLKTQGVVIIEFFIGQLQVATTAEPRS